VILRERTNSTARAFSASSFPPPNGGASCLRHTFEVDPAQLAQYQAIGYEALGLSVATVVEPPHNKRPEDHLDRRARTPARAGRQKAACTLPARPLEGGIIVEEPIELSRHGLEVQ
jgi:hypothetical protein